MCTPTNPSGGISSIPVARIFASETLTSSLAAANLYTQYLHN